MVSRQTTAVLVHGMCQIHAGAAPRRRRFHCGQRDGSVSATGGGEGQKANNIVSTLTGTINLRRAAAVVSGAVLTLQRRFIVVKYLMCM